MPRQPVVVFNGQLSVEKGLKIVQIILLDDNNHFFDASLDGFFNNVQDGWPGYALAIDNREQLFLDRLRSREEAGAKSSGGDDRLADFLGRAEG